MIEAGARERVPAVKSMIGKDTWLITCLANLNAQDLTRIVPAILKVAGSQRTVGQRPKGMVR